MNLTFDSNARDSGDDSDFYIRLAASEKLITDSSGQTYPKLSISRIRTWNSWHNITANNNVVRWLNGDTWKTKTIAPGNYTLQDIFDAIHQLMYDEGDYDNSGDVPAYYINFEYNRNTSKIKVSVSNDYQLNLGYTGSPSTIFGSDSLITETTILENPADIMNGLKYIVLNCNLVRRNRLNKHVSYMLTTFFPAAPPGGLIELEYDEPYVNVASGYEIDEVHLWLTDDQGRAFSMNAPMQVAVHLSYND